jgi:3-deoxy-D-arabino-heptulosonate 7-phosphate (DAHP) synthase
MSQAAMAAGADGLLVETHPNPEKAAVDRLNAITIENCGWLFQTINKR